MNHDHIAQALETDAGLRLLRSDNAPLVISFLHSRFKQPPRVAVPHQEMLERLEDYLLALRARDPDAYPSTAEVYLKRWCDEGHQYLRRYFEAGSDDPTYELTPATERAIGWLEALNTHAFVGTESRFQQIFDLLGEMVHRSTEDPATRMAQLEKQQEALQREADAIRQSGRVERYNATQIRERFFKANDEARRLLADFREVEVNFRDLTRSVQERRLVEGATKGDVVAHVIDADDALEASDQGRSFYAFWRFLIARDKKEELRRLLEAAYTLPEVVPLRDEYRLLRNLVDHLSDAGGKIVQSNRRLADQLRRMLDEAHRSEHRRVQELVSAIKKEALHLREEPPDGRAILYLDAPQPEIHLPMERPLWQPGEHSTFGEQPQEIEDTVLDDIDLSGLFDLYAVEREQVEQRIRSTLQRQSRITLADMVERFPVEKGLSELLVYLAIASDDSRHEVDDETGVALTVQGPEGQRYRVTAPSVVFHRVAPHAAVQRREEAADA